MLVLMKTDAYKEVRDKMFRHIDFECENRREKDAIVKWAARQVVSKLTIGDITRYVGECEIDWAKARTCVTLMDMVEGIKEELLPVLYDFLNDDAIEEARRRRK